MLDENKYPTMKLLRCKKCGNVFAESLAGTTDCPECSSADASQYQPDSFDNKDDTVQ